MNRLTAYQLLAEAAFTGVEQHSDPATQLIAVYESLAIVAQGLGLFDEADHARQAADALLAADEAVRVAQSHQLKFKGFLGNGSHGPNGKDGHA